MNSDQVQSKHIPPYWQQDQPRLHASKVNHKNWLIFWGPAGLPGKNWQSKYSTQLWLYDCCCPGQPLLKAIVSKHQLKNKTYEAELIMLHVPGMCMCIITVICWVGKCKKVIQQQCPSVACTSTIPHSWSMVPMPQLDNWNQQMLLYYE